MTIAITNSGFPKSATDALEKEGFKTIPLPASKSLDQPMASHPDMLIFVGFDSLVCHRKYYEENKTVIDLIASEGALSLVLSDEEISPKYPLDALFNACIVGNMLLCNTKHISKHIIEIARSRGANIVHVNQGYTKCSTLVVNDNNIITSDRGIHLTAQRADINSLLIEIGGVSLNPFEYGFIGGASGSCGSKIYFCGNLYGHPDKYKICEFITLCGKECVFLPFDELTDTGSMFFIE